MRAFIIVFILFATISDTYACNRWGCRSKFVNINTFQISAYICSPIMPSLSCSIENPSIKSYTSLVESKDDATESTPESRLKAAMINSIKWYRSYLSPIMPPNCRFFPSCSVYAIEAVQMFGPLKGGLLIAWRLFRCNPFGGSGYGERAFLF